MAHVFSFPCQNKSFLHQIVVTEIGSPKETIMWSAVVKREQTRSTRNLQRRLHVLYTITQGNPI